MYLNKQKAVKFNDVNAEGITIEGVSTFDELGQRKQVVKLLTDISNGDDKAFKRHLMACTVIFCGGQFGGDDRKTKNLVAKIDGKPFDYGSILGLKSGKGRSIDGDDLTASRVAGVLLPEAFSMVNSPLFENSAIRRKVGTVWTDESSAMYVFTEGFKLHEKVETGFDNAMKTKVFAANICWAMLTAEKSKDPEVVINVGRTIASSAMRQSIDPDLLDQYMNMHAAGVGTASARGVMKYFNQRAQRMIGAATRSYAGVEGVIEEEEVLEDPKGKRKVGQTYPPRRGYPYNY